MRPIPFALVSLVLMCGSAIAQEVPDFLFGKTYATEPAACGSMMDYDGDGLKITKDGISGLEFGCQFLNFRADRDKESGKVFGYVATVNCGDDSGINRPDLISMSHWDGQLMVQSQNEYVLSEAEIMIAEKLGKDFPEKSSYSWVSNTYKLCK